MLLKIGIFAALGGFLYGCVLCEVSESADNVYSIVGSSTAQQQQPEFL